jgi:hypothetical protein
VRDHRGAGSRGLGRDGLYDRGAVVGASDDERFQILAILRTFRAKLASILEVVPPSAHQIFLQIDARPPREHGGVGGDDQYLTPANLGLVNWALARTGEAPIAIDPIPPRAERPDDRSAVSREDVGQILPRVERAIARTA